MQELVMCATVLGLMLADIVTGYVGACKQGSLSSSKMREGLFKKAGSLSLMLLGVAIEHVGVYVGVDATICAAIAVGICGMLAVMELTSCVENCCRLNPDLPVAKVFALFGLEGDDELQD